MEEVTVKQIIIQLSFDGNNTLRVIPQDENGDNIKFIGSSDFTVEELAVLDAAIDMVKNK